MKTVAIIGGGLTGLIAALRLSKKGYKVSIYEKGSELGGLAAGFQIHGNNLEKAYHHLFKTDTDIISLVEELGLTDKLKWYESSVSIYYDNNLYPFKSPFDLIKFSPLSFVNRIRAGLVVFFLQKYSNYKSLLKYSAYEWMLKYGGKQVMKVIWEPLLKGKFDNYYKDVSMAWLWARIHIRANSRSSKNPLSKEMLGYFEGGFNVLIKEIIKQLKKQDVEIFLNSDISSITSKSDKNSKPNIIIDKKNFQFNKIVATVPNHVFSKLIISNSNLKNYLSQLNKITYLGAVLIVFSSKQDLSKYYWHNINDLNSPFLVLINHTKLVGTKDYQNNNLYYLGSYVPHDHKYFSMEDKELYNLWFDQVKQIFPDFDVNKLIEKHIFKFKYAQHIVDRDYLTKIPSYQTPLKNVYLSNFSQIFPEDRGTNYAVREGNKIAELISNDLENE